MSVARVLIFSSLSSAAGGPARMGPIVGARGGSLFVGVCDRDLGPGTSFPPCSHFTHHKQGGRAYPSQALRYGGLFLFDALDADGVGGGQLKDFGTDLPWLDVQPSSLCPSPPCWDTGSEANCASHY